MEELKANTYHDITVHDCSVVAAVVASLLG